MTFHKSVKRVAERVTSRTTVESESDQEMSERDDGSEWTDSDAADVAAFSGEDVVGGEEARGSDPEEGEVQEEEGAVVDRGGDVGRRTVTCRVVLRRIHDGASELERLRSGVIVNFSSSRLDGGHKDHWLRTNLFYSLASDFDNTTQITKFMENPQRYARWPHAPQLPGPWESRIYKFGNDGYYVHVWCYPSYRHYGIDNRVQTRAWLETNLAGLVRLARTKNIYLFHGRAADAPADATQLLRPTLTSPTTYAAAAAAMPTLPSYVIAKQRLATYPMAAALPRARKVPPVSYVCYDLDTTLV